MRKALLWGSENRWLEHQFRRRRFAKRAVSRFMPGERPEDALGEAAVLAESGISTLVTCLGENVVDQAAVDAVVQGYVDVVERIGQQELDTHLSVKLTHLGLDLAEEIAADSVRRIAEAAAREKGWIWVDMEYSRYVDATLRVFEAARETNPNLGLCLQAYLHRTPEDLERIAGVGSPVRMVKGAYQESAEVAMPDKGDVDQAFEKLSLRLLELSKPGVPVPGIATHDRPLIARIRDEATRRGYPQDAYEVQMLYGIERAAQQELVREAVPVRVLISYGEAWFPWYMRRLAERPANIGFVVRSMFTR